MTVFIFVYGILIFLFYGFHDIKDTFSAKLVESGIDCANIQNKERPKDQSLIFLLQCKSADMK